MLHIRRRKRIAWIGSPSSGGGVGGMCRIILRELAKEDISLDIYSDCDASELSELRAALMQTNVRLYKYTYNWEWNSWYGRRKQVAFLASFIKRLRCYRRLVSGLIANHRRDAYDAVIQFSQGELFQLGRYRNEIPIILFPCVHAAGELHWCRREEHLARRCESYLWRHFRFAYLRYRSSLQNRDYRRATGVIGMSRRFIECVKKDYGVPSENTGVVYQPMDFHDHSPAAQAGSRPIRLLFVGRISVRKGVDLLLEAIPRVLQRHPDVEVVIVGGGSLWSSYEPLLDELPKERCRWLRALPSSDVIAQMQNADVLLVPSYYEPGGIVVAEALACGVTIVASDEVGSAENLRLPVCHHFKSGHAAEFESAIDAALDEVRKRGPELRNVAHDVAVEQFASEKIARQLLSEVERLVRYGLAMRS